MLFRSAINAQDGGNIVLQTGYVNRLEITHATGLVTVNNGLSGAVTRSTAVATGSGTSITFTSLPSWVKRITVLLDSVSISTFDDLFLRVRVGGSSITSGYSQNGGFLTMPGSLGTVTGIEAGSTGAAFRLYSDSQLNLFHGCIKLMNITGNTWTMEATYTWGTNKFGVASGRISLANTLDGVELRSSSGTATFDNASGFVNIMYEG